MADRFLTWLSRNLLMICFALVQMVYGGFFVSTQYSFLHKTMMDAYGNTVGMTLLSFAGALLLCATLTPRFLSLAAGLSAAAWFSAFFAFIHIKTVTPGVLGMLVLAIGTILRVWLNAYIHRKG